MFEIVRKDTNRGDVSSTRPICHSIEGRVWSVGEELAIQSYKLIVFEIVKKDTNKADAL